MVAIALSELAPTAKVWLETNGNWLRTLGTVVAGVVAFVSLVSQWISGRRQQTEKNRREAASSRIKSTSSFEIVLPGGDVFPHVFRQEVTGLLAELADRKIPYQERIKGQDTQQKLEDNLRKGKGKLLISGRTGLGKTREAAELLQLLNGEGWTILVPKNLRSLDVPTDDSALFKEIGTTRKILLFLDDLNQAMEFCRGQREIANQLGEFGQNSLLEIPLQERLLRTIRWFENYCGNSEIFVIATARSEREVNSNDARSAWDKLQWDDFPVFWELFHRYELKQPEDDSVVSLLEALVSQAGLEAKKEEFDAIAAKNDRTFRNIVENLRRFKSRNRQVTCDGFTGSLRGTWQDRYQRAVERYPLAQFVYSAISLLQKFQVPLDTETVEFVTMVVAEGAWFRKLWWKFFRLNRTIDYLIKLEQLLEPRDGQLEVAIPVNEQTKIIAITERIYRLANQQGQTYLTALFTCALHFQSDEDYSNAVRFYKKAIKLKPDYHEAWNNLGVTQDLLGRSKQAIKSYEEALKLKPDLYKAWNNKGIALRNDGRIEDAIASYDKALELNPDYHEAWNNRGIALRNYDRIENAIASYDKALDLNPDYHEAWNNRGNTLCDLDRIEEAIVAYDKALGLNPDCHEASKNRGIALALLGRTEEAIIAYRKTLELKSNDHEAWVILGIALFTSGRSEDAIICYNKAIALNPDCHEAFFNRGNAKCNLGLNEEGVADLEKAKKLKPGDRDTIDAINYANCL